MNNNKIIKNLLISELGGFISEFNLGTLTEKDIYQYFSNILISANVSSDMVVSVLEDENFNKIAKEVALGIKINEGW
jgi:hypothetical protein